MKFYYAYEQVVAMDRVQFRLIDSAITILKLMEIMVCVYKELRELEPDSFAA